MGFNSGFKGLISHTHNTFWWNFKPQFIGRIRRNRGRPIKQSTTLYRLKTQITCHSIVAQKLIKIHNYTTDFCYLCSIVAENGGTSREVNVRIQKARGSFSNLRRVWLSKSLRKDTKIRIFNACVKYVLLYGCETWLVTNEIQRKIQTFVNRCLRYILRIW